MPLVEFAYNNSYQASIDMTPFEALYERLFRLPTRWLEGGEPLIIGSKLLQDTQHVAKLIRQWLMTTQDRQCYYSD